MNNKVTIVAYHYVRDLKNSRYPEIKGLEVSDFKEQLGYILKYYKVIRAEDLIGAIVNRKKLPANSLLLTFDDGYKDHYDFVFPILNELGIQGTFFPVAEAIKEHRLLDSNKVHFILASCNDKRQIISDIYAMVDKFRKRYFLESNEYYYNKLAVDGRFDPKEVIFIKRMLQRELPEELRNKIANFLFTKYVSNDEHSFSRELYVSEDQLKHMKRSGMYIGSHGFSHYWLNTLSEPEQKKDIELSLKFLKGLGCDTRNFIFCYPYGAYNDSLLSLLKEKGCLFAVTVEENIADLNSHQPLLLPRLDTNHLPKDSRAKP